MFLLERKPPEKLRVIDYLSAMETISLYRHTFVQLTLMQASKIS